MISFLLSYKYATGKISDFFNYKIFPSHPDNFTHIGALLNQIIDYHNKGEILYRNMELNRILFLIQHLEIIKEHDSSLLKYFIRELKKQGTQDVFWGVRFELGTAVSLINKNIPFLKQESPDFILSNQCSIECSSARIRKENDKTDLDYKILSVINKKGKEEYCSNSLVLFIDITNLVYDLHKRNQYINTSKTKEFVKNKIQDYDMGSIIFFSHIHPKNEDNIRSVYNRIDNESIDSELKKFLDTYYSFGEVDFDDYGVTYET